MVGVIIGAFFGAAIGVAVMALVKVGGCDRNDTEEPFYKGYNTSEK